MSKESLVKLRAHSTLADFSPFESRCRSVLIQYGDYDEATYQPEMLATEDLLPQRVIDQYQMTPEMWAEKIKLWYTDFHGMQRYI